MNKKTPLKNNMTNRKRSKLKTFLDKELKKIQKDTLKKTFESLLLLNIDELKEIIGMGLGEAPGGGNRINVIKYLCAAVIFRAIRTGDEKKLEWIYYQIFDRPPDKLEIVTGDYPNLTKISTPMIERAVKKLSAPDSYISLDEESRPQNNT